MRYLLIKMERLDHRLCQLLLMLIRRFPRQPETLQVLSRNALSKVVYPPNSIEAYALKILGVKEEDKYIYCEICGKVSKVDKYSFKINQRND